VRFVQSVWQPGAPQPARQSLEADEAVEPPIGEGADAVRRPSLRDLADDERLPRSQADYSAAADVAMPAIGGLAQEDVQKLRAALHDLTECRRLLNAAVEEKN
jgi:hypothetical protein